jgi:hypothetical protein
MTTRTDEARQDRAVEDSFPASDPPATSGITGPRVARPAREPGRQTRKSGEDMRPKGTPTDDRHATATAYQREHQERPPHR